MEIEFVEAHFKGKIELPEKFIKALPQKIGLFTTVQYINQIQNIKMQIEGKGKTVTLFKTRHSEHSGQLLGCSIQEFSGVDAFVYIGDGLFHPRALVIKNNLPVHIYNPLSEKTSLIDKKDVEKILKKQKGAYMKFLSAKNIGVLVSTKPGQNRYKDSKKLEKKYPDKEFFYLVFDTIEFSGLENFVFIDCFVNTACPRIGLDDTINLEKPVVNVDEIL
ncbi:hypothetical protein GF327_07425 [Candidatus Woesearchaeota archaeon]|nr:hypothetical protein [Candidatus Woesearchaeota archaeon]